MDSLQSLIYTSSSSDGISQATASLKVLDQLLLPREKVYIDVNNTEDAWQVGGYSR